MDAFNVLAVARPLGRCQKRRWHYARRDPGGVRGRYTKRSKRTPHKNTKQYNNIAPRAACAFTEGLWDHKKPLSPCQQCQLLHWTDNAAPSTKTR